MQIEQRGLNVKLEKLLGLGQGLSGGSVSYFDVSSVLSTILEKVPLHWTKSNKK